MLTARSFIFPKIPAALLLGAILITLASSCSNERGNPPSSTASVSSVAGARAIFDTATGGAVLHIEIARTPQEKARGLMERESLPSGQGMIFIHDQPTQGAFWMKNTYIPLSIAFISAEGYVVDIQDMEPLTLELHRSAYPYIYAVETNRGFFNSNGVKVGSRVRFEGI